MKKTRREYINVLANTIRSGLKLTIPFDLNDVVHKLGGEIREVDQITSSPECEASIIPQQGNNPEFIIEILLKNQHSVTRNRFTIAHEIGHLFLHMGYLMEGERWANAASYYRQGYGPDELEANEFAAAFLMPEDEFEKLIIDDCTPEDIANHFRVSLPAVYNRGKFLGLYSRF